MPSKYLGYVNGSEAHAFSENGMYKDTSLSKQLHRARYDLLSTKRKPIFCTAVNPDHYKKEEHNPHDALPTTTHFAMINKKTGEIDYALSTAKYSEELGIPLENRFSPNGYPPGAPLDEFVSQFLRKNYGVDKDVESERIIEIYRHIRNPKTKLNCIRNLGIRLALYAAVYQHLIRNVIKEGRTPSDLWVWDAIPKYADKYGLVTGVYRDFTIKNGDKTKWVTTRLSKLEEREINGVKHYFLDGRQVTRNLPILFPPNEGKFDAQHPGEIRPVGMIDGLVDVRRAEYLIKKHPYLFPNGGFPDFVYRLKKRAAMGVVGNRGYKDYHGRNLGSRAFDLFSQFATGAFPWKIEEGSKESNGSLLELTSNLHPLYETLYEADM